MNSSSLIDEADAVLARAIAAQMAGRNDPIELARHEERAREIRMRDVKAAQRRVDEERKKVSPMPTVWRQLTPGLSRRRKFCAKLRRRPSLASWS